MCSFFLFVPSMHCQDVFFRQCTCQDVSSLGRGLCVCVHVCVFFPFISALNALSRCVMFRQCTCQDVSSFGRGSCVCVCVLSFYFCPKCIVKMSSFGNAPVKMCLLSARGLVCVHVLSNSFCPQCIVKMCRLSAGGLVCVFFLFISALNALSRYVVFRQCTCQDVSSFGRGSCVCVRSFFLFLP